MFSSDFSNLKEAFLHETNTKLGLFGSINLVYLETSSKGECSILNPSSVLLRDSGPSDTVSKDRPSAAQRKTTWERSQVPLSPLRPAFRAPAKHAP